MKAKWYLLILFINGVFAQQTAIPDSNFEQALIDLGYDSGTPDGTVPTANIESISFLDVDDKNIIDLTGIEDFNALITLRCSSNQLTALNISQNSLLTTLEANNNNLIALNLTQNTVLQYIDFESNQLTNLDVSENPNLTFLNCSGNNLQALDVTANTALDKLYCTYNNLQTLDVTANTALLFLLCNDNNLQALDVTANTALKVLHCFNNNLEGLDVTANTALEEFFCLNNNLQALDVTANTALLFLLCTNNNLQELDITTNTALLYLSCTNNNLEELDLSQNIDLWKLECAMNNLEELDITSNTVLEILDCSENSLSYLNIKSGSNNRISTSGFNATNNPNLECIEVDDVNYSQTNWTNIDSQTSFSENCGFAQEPANNECANAEVINVETASATTVILNNALATESLESTCDIADDVYLDLWYAFTMPIDGNLRLTNIDGIDRITVYEGCEGNEIQCFTSPNFIYNLPAGDYILRHSTLESFAGDHSFTIQAFDIVGNDECANAETITVQTEAPTTVVLNNAMATQSTQASCDIDNNDYLDVWYAFTMPINGNLRITGTDIIDRISLYENTCSGPEMACFKSPNFIYNLEAGDYILRYSTFDEFAGPESFKIQAFDIISNDTCANAQNISVATIGNCVLENVSVDLRGSTQVFPTNNSCVDESQPYMDAWFTFEAPVTGNVTINLSNALIYYSVYNACDGTQIVCGHNNLGLIPVVYGKTYTLQIIRRDIFAEVSTFCLEGAPNIAPGTIGGCENIPTIEISENQGNTNQWFPILDDSDNIVAAIHANGNDLGEVNTTLFIEDANTREVNGRNYLSREVSISTENAPSSDVDIRLFVLDNEVENLILVDSNLDTADGLGIMKVEGSGCTEGYTSGGDFFGANTTNYTNGYYLSFDVDSFSVFYPTSTDLSSTLGIKNTLDPNFKASIYPTITDGLITIQFNEQVDKIKVLVFDVNGREVYSEQSNNVGLGGKIQLELDDLSKGLYFITLSNTEVFETKKIILK